MVVGVPERMHMAHLEAAPLARLERRVPAALHLALHQAVVLHVARDGGRARHAPELGLLLREREQVLAVQLVRPARVLPVLELERLRQLEAHRRMRTCVRGNLAREHLDGVSNLVLRRVVPPLDRRDAVSQRLPCRGMRPPPRREGREVRPQLTGWGWARDQRAHDREAKARRVLTRDSYRPCRAPPRTHREIRCFGPCGSPYGTGGSEPYGQALRGVMAPSPSVLIRGRPNPSSTARTTEASPWSG